MSAVALGGGSDQFVERGPKLLGDPGDGAGEFGYDVAQSAAGNTALIGTGEGVWVLSRSGSAWTRQGKRLTGSGAAAGGEFGLSVALSAAGNTSLVGGPIDPVAGAAWVFHR